jgi:Transposase IS200 like
MVAGTVMVSALSEAVARKSGWVCASRPSFGGAKGTAFKGRTAYAVRREYTGRCVRAHMRGHLWSPSYFAVSCAGAPRSNIKQYIDNQARPL